MPTVVHGAEVVNDGRDVNEAGSGSIQPIQPSHLFIRLNLNSRARLFCAVQYICNMYIAHCAIKIFIIYERNTTRSPGAFLAPTSTRSSSRRHSGYGGAGAGGITYWENIYIYNIEICLTDSTESSLTLILAPHGALGGVTRSMSDF